jgi:PPOX class probable F420-dependent enzyme
VSAALPAQARELIDTPEPAVLGTLNPDGSTHLCMMWVAREGDHLLMSTRAHRRQYANLERDPRASVLVYSRLLPRRYVDIRGRAELGGAGADELIRRLSLAYLGREHSTLIDYEPRAMIRVLPEHVRMHE